MFAFLQKKDQLVIIDTCSFFLELISNKNTHAKIELPTGLDYKLEYRTQQSSNHILLTPSISKLLDKQYNTK